MVSTGAMRFRSPNQTATSAIPRVRTVPTRGLSSSPLPLPTHWSHRGRIPSLARACSTRGAPSMDPTALLSVAPQTPRRMASPQTEIRRMTSGSATRLAVSTRKARITGSVM